MLFIFANSVSLAIYDYSDPDNLTSYNYVLYEVGRAFSVAFAVESFLKILAQGFIVSKKSYLRDGWNVLDFIIVLPGVLDFLPTSVGINIKSLRILRALRPLRSINAVPRMKRLVKTLIKSIP